MRVCGRRCWWVNRSGSLASRSRQILLATQQVKRGFGPGSRKGDLQPSGAHEGGVVGVEGPAGEARCVFAGAVGGWRRAGSGAGWSAGGDQLRRIRSGFDDAGRRRARDRARGRSTSPGRSGSALRTVSAVLQLAHHLHAVPMSGRPSPMQRSGRKAGARARAADVERASVRSGSRSGQAHADQRRPGRPRARRSGARLIGPGSLRRDPWWCLRCGSCFLSVAGAVGDAVFDLAAAPGPARAGR